MPRGTSSCLQAVGRLDILNDVHFQAGFADRNGAGVWRRSSGLPVKRAETGPP